jgi:hypothetical protein
VDSLYLKGIYRSVAKKSNKLTPDNGIRFRNNSSYAGAASEGGGDVLLPIIYLFDYLFCIVLVVDWKGR